MVKTNHSMAATVVMLRSTEKKLSSGKSTSTVKSSLHVGMVIARNDFDQREVPPSDPDKRALMARRIRLPSANDPAAGMG